MSTDANSDITNKKVQSGLWFHSDQRETLKKAFQRVRIVQRGTESLESSKCM